MNLNKVFLVGRLGADPIERETAKGETVLNLSLATNSGWGDNIKTDWHKVVAFGKVATGVGGAGLVKGQAGVERMSSDIIASKVEFGSRAKSSNEQTSPEDDNIPF